MNVRTLIRINDTITAQDAARLTGFLVRLKGTLNHPSTKIAGDGTVEIVWFTNHGTIVEAAAMWFPMLLAAWLHIDRTIESIDITEIRFREERP